MKTILISAFQPFVSRNILNTGVLDELIGRGLRVVVLVPDAKADFYRATYGTMGVIVEGVNVSLLNTRTERFFQRASELLLNTHTKLFHKLIERFYGGSAIKYFLSRAVTLLLGPWGLPKRALRFLEYRVYRPRLFDNFFISHQPDAVFASHVFGDMDAALIKDARRAGIRTVGMVVSWDNPTSKQVLRAQPDVLLAHNEGICQELKDLHAVEGALAIGVPHYDYAKAYRPVGREELCGTLGVPAERAIILVSPAGQKFIDTDCEIFKILSEARASGRFIKPVHFLIRVHPSNKIKFGDFVPDEHCTVEEPGVRFEGVREKDNELDMAGFNHLLDEIEHSAIVINTLSSIAIDACVRERPVVTVGFDGLQTHVPFERSVGLYHEEENMAKLLTTGGAPVAESPKRLIELINGYLEDPKKDEACRTALIAQQCMQLDGRAKVRLADAICGLSV